LPQIFIDRPHGLSLADAQAIAAAWAQSAQDDFGMQVQRAPEPAQPQDEVLWHFRRTGAHGSLRVTAERFVLDVTLGFLLGTYKDRIEAGLLQSLEQRLQAISAIRPGSALLDSIAPKA
jgi:Putative polyhydroxyalkanoic acid system protein (PHA_gran_rgn)